MTKHDDHMTFQGLINGSETALKRVYVQNRPVFLNFAKRYETDRQDALDIYQDAIIALYENVRNGKLTELRSSLSTYLMSIGKYMILEHIRRNKKRTDGQHFMERIPDTDPQLSAFELDLEPMNSRQALLQKHFERLGEKCKDILTWFYYRKLSIREIMQRGGYNSENVVKSQKSRCLKTLKESIKKSV